MVVALSLVAALTYGVSDFIGGLTTRRAGPWAVALVAELAGACGTGLVALLHPGSPTGSDFAWALLAGVGNGIGTSCLYRGLGSGRMGVVAPVSGVGAAVVPVVLGLALGERLGPLAAAGVVLALPAIWLVAREPTEPSAAPRRSGLPPGLADGLLAGAGFGTLFAALSRLGPDAGLAPFCLDQLVGATVIVVAATALPSLTGPGALSRRDLIGPALGGGVPGVLGTSATVLFTVATRRGRLSVTAVVTSLYPAFTVLLAAVVLRERIHRHQSAGLALCALAVVLVAL